MNGTQAQLIRNYMIEIYQVLSHIFTYCCLEPVTLKKKQSVVWSGIVYIYVSLDLDVKKVFDGAISLIWCIRSYTVKFLPFYGYIQCIYKCICWNLLPQRVKLEHLYNFCSSYSKAPSNQELTLFMGIQSYAYVH